MLNVTHVQNLEDSDWTNSLYTSPVSGLDNSSFFRDDEANLSSALLKEDDPGEAGEGKTKRLPAPVPMHCVGLGSKN